MRKPRRALLILVVAILAVAVPASLAIGDSGAPGATASKGKKKSKKCKKGYVKIKKQCKKKKTPPKAPTPTPPVLPSLVPQIGEYTGDALVSSFKLLSYPGAQGRVEMTATVPVTGCKSKTTLSFTIGDRGEYALVNSNKFTYVYSFNDEFGSKTAAIGGLWTSSTTVLGSIDLSETYNGETCVTGVQQFHATAK